MDTMDAYPDVAIYSYCAYTAKLFDSWNSGCWHLKAVIYVMLRCSVTWLQGRAQGTVVIHRSSKISTPHVLFITLYKLRSVPFDVHYYSV